MGSISSLVTRMTTGDDFFVVRMSKRWKCSFKLESTPSMAGDRAIGGNIHGTIRKEDNLMRIQMWTVLCLLKMVEKLEMNSGLGNLGRSKEGKRLKRKYLKKLRKIPKQHPGGFRMFLDVVSLIVKILSLILNLPSKTCTQNRVGYFAREKHTHIAAAESGQLSYDNS